MSAFFKRTSSAFASLLVAIAIFCSPVFASSGASSLPGDVAASAGENTTGQESAPEEANGDTSALDEGSLGADVVGFYVRAIIPTNQMDTRQTYFNLRMQPGQRQELEVQLVNETGEDIFVDVEAITASTNSNGIIDYKTPGVQDESLKTAFSDIAEVEDSPVLVPAGGEAMVTVLLTMPEEEYDGVLLGGLVFTKELPEQTEDGSSLAGQSAADAGGGTAITNVYSYVLGVVLQETDAEIQPDFALLGVEPALVNYQPGYVYSLRNTVPYIVKNMDVYAAVYEGEDTSAEPIVSRFKENMDMAPNSVLRFAVTPESGELEAGDYTSTITIRYGGEEWLFTERFTVQAEEAQSVNDSAPGPASTPIPWATLLLAIMGVLLIGLAATVIILLVRRRKPGNK